MRARTDDGSYTFEYRPGTIHHGVGVVDEIGTELDRHGRSRALVVTDATLAGIGDVIDPIEAGVGDRLVGVFDGVTPEKYLKTASEGARRVRDEDVDALVAVGGGSSLDTAKLIAVLAGHGDPEAAAREMVDREAVLVPDDGSLTDIVAVPTTLPGAELSQVVGVKLSLNPDGKSKSEIPSGASPTPG